MIRERIKRVLWVLACAFVLARVLQPEITAATVYFFGSGVGGTVESAEITDGTIATADIANNAVDGAKIAIASQATGDLMSYDGTDWVRLARGAAGTVLHGAGSGAPAYSGVVSADITDGTIATDDMADNAINGAKIAISSNASGDLMRYDGTDWVRLAAGGNNTVLHGTTPPAYSAIVSADITDGTIVDADLATPTAGLATTSLYGTVNTTDTTPTACGASYTVASGKAVELWMTQVGRLTVDDGSIVRYHRRTLYTVIAGTLAARATAASSADFESTTPTDISSVSFTVPTVSTLTIQPTVTGKSATNMTWFCYTHIILY